MTIHYNIEAAEAFCMDLRRICEHLEERAGDERAAYDVAFDAWRDHRGEAVKNRLAELTQIRDRIAGEIGELEMMVREQIRFAREFLEADQRW